MKNKPELSTKKSRMQKAKQELGVEQGVGSTKQTTLVLPEELFFNIKEILLKRKRVGTKPDTLSALIREVLEEIIKKEKAAP